MPQCTIAGTRIGKPSLPYCAFAGARIRKPSLPWYVFADARIRQCVCPSRCKHIRYDCRLRNMSAERNWVTNGDEGEKREVIQDSAFNTVVTSYYTTFREACPGRHGLNAKLAAHDGSSETKSISVSPHPDPLSPAPRSCSPTHSYAALPRHSSKSVAPRLHNPQSHSS